jgi:hypothetical protein
MGKKPGFTERIMTVMFSKVFSFIALLDNHHSRVGQALGLSRRHIRRSLHAHI